MLLAHLAVAGVVESALTVGVVTYLQRANLPILRINHPGVPASADELRPARPLGYRWALVGLAVMALLSPLGLLAPGGAFGEDAPVDLNLHRYHLDAVPQGLADYAGFWHHALFGGYGFAGGSHEYAGYIVSALVGMGVIALAILAIVAASAWCAVRRGRSPGPSDGRRRAGLAARSRRSASVRAAASAGAGRGASSTGRSGRRGLLRRAMFSDDVRRPARAAATDRSPGQVRHPARPARVAAAFVQHIPVLLACTALPPALAAASRLPVALLPQARVAVRPDLHRASWCCRRR